MWPGVEGVLGASWKLANSRSATVLLRGTARWHLILDVRANVLGREFRGMMVSGDAQGDREIAKGGQQKEGLIMVRFVHYLGPPGGRVKRGLDRGGPENGRYQGELCDRPVEQRQPAQAGAGTSRRKS